jgi:coniferyl-aldehyde dehydrogenase
LKTPGRKSANVLQIGVASGSGKAAAGARKLPPTLIVGATQEMSVMQDEIFGPILPVIPYTTLDDAIACVNAGRDHSPSTYSATIATLSITFSSVRRAAT